MIKEFFFKRKYILELETELNIQRKANIELFQENQRLIGINLQKRMDVTPMYREINTDGIKIRIKNN